MKMKEINKLSTFDHSSLRYILAIRRIKNPRDSINLCLKTICVQNIVAKHLYSLNYSLFFLPAYRRD